MATSTTKRRRTAVEIIQKILATCDNGGAKKTAIMYRCNLSYGQLSRYLLALSSQKLIRRNETGRFQITPKGESTLKDLLPVVMTVRNLTKTDRPAPTPVDV